MSLDEIIAHQKSATGAGRGRRALKGRGFSSRRRTSGDRFNDDNSFFVKSSGVPQGKWDHDGFEEMYGDASNGDSSARLVKGGGRAFNRVALSRKVKIHITGLAPSVSSQDLVDLFADFPVDSAVLNFNEDGLSTGTADIVTDRATAEEISKQFAGISVDNQPIHIFVLDERNDSLASRVSYTDPPPIRSRGITKRYGNLTKWPSFNQRSAKIKRGENKRSKMTEEELDRELDEYMKRGLAARSAKAQSMET